MVNGGSGLAHLLPDGPHPTAEGSKVLGRTIPHEVAAEGFRRLTSLPHPLSGAEWGHACGSTAAVHAPLAPLRERGRG
jgi:hypothetical protein